LLFGSSPWFIIACIGVGILYSWLLYSAKSPWNSSLNYILFTLRAFVVGLICFLLTAPYLELVANYTEKPLVVLLVDNSESVSMTMDDDDLAQFTNNLTEVSATYRDQNCEVRIIDLNQQIIPNNSISFAGSITNLSSALNFVQSAFSTENLAEVVLFSDGIYNRGLSPAYNEYPFQIKTVGLGDTVPKNDVKLTGLRYNKIAYQGNQYPLEVNILNEGFAGKNIKVQLANDQTILKEQIITLNADGLNKLNFLIDAEEAGLNVIKVSIEKLAGDYNLQNNSQSAYVDVIEGRQKILIAAAAPHPDIRALNAALSSNRNYEIEIYIEGIDNLTTLDHDLVITHNLPVPNKGLPVVLEGFVEDEVPFFIFAGYNTNLEIINEQYGVVPRSSNSPDEVFPAYNAKFGSFSLSEKQETQLQRYPPVTVPFGNYGVPGQYNVLLYQKVGSLVTSKPLLVFGQQAGRKIGLFTGEGIWQWRLNEFQRDENADSFDDLINKCVQFLVSKEDRKRLRVYPTDQEFFDNEEIALINEFYDEVYEPVFGQEIALKITSSDESILRQFQFKTQEFNSDFTLSNLPTGRYDYVATTVFEDKEFRAEGTFLVKELNLESQELTAKHDLLRELSYKTGASFYKFENMSELVSEVEENEYRSIIHSDYDYQPLIDLKWIFFILFLLLSLEWFLRKYYGAY